MAGWFENWNLDGLPYNPAASLNVLSDLALALRERQVAVNQTPTVYSYPGKSDPDPIDFFGLVFDDFETFLGELYDGIVLCTTGPDFFVESSSPNVLLDSFADVAAEAGVAVTPPSLVRTDTNVYDWFQSLILALLWVKDIEQFDSWSPFWSTIRTGVKTIAVTSIKTYSQLQQDDWNIAFIPNIGNNSNLLECRIEHTGEEFGGPGTQFQSTFEIRQIAFEVIYANILPPGFVLLTQSPQTITIRKHVFNHNSTYAVNPAATTARFRINGIDKITHILAPTGGGGFVDSAPSTVFTPGGASDTFSFVVDFLTYWEFSNPVIGQTHHDGVRFTVGIGDEREYDVVYAYPKVFAFT